MLTLAMLDADLAGVGVGDVGLAVVAFSLSSCSSFLPGTGVGDTDLGDVGTLAAIGVFGSTEDGLLIADPLGVLVGEVPLLLSLQGVRAGEPTDSLFASVSSPSRLVIIV
jgi:hypothetical protein